MKKHLGLLSVLWFSTTVAAESRIDWYVTHGDATNQKSLRIGDTNQVIPLRNQWSCSVEAPSIGGARQTTCRKGNEAFEFTVQCEETRMKDHTQIRFRDSGQKVNEYIEVGCELLK